MAFANRLSTDQALQKARHYCAYQERCHAEVKEKLYSFGLYKNEVEELLSQLIQDDYLNEERFAIQFAGGKYRMRQWGRKKIQYALRQKQVSDYCIRKALQQFEEEDYLETLQQLAVKKWQAVKESGGSRYEWMAKTTDFLLQKGYESELIRQAIAGLE